ncbi:MAG: S-layer homology domain-containing protein [Clostridiales bacterium]|nr:MAG: S-layer homology domain-containing protein [Clostridiales bacterium]
MKKVFVKGYEDGTFKPKGAITREELVKVLLGAFGIEVDENADVSAFTDAESIKRSAPYIAKSGGKKGIIKGYEDGSGKPQNTVTRIEAITMFGRAMSAK